MTISSPLRYFESLSQVCIDFSHNLEERRRIHSSVRCPELDVQYVLTVARSVDPECATIRIPDAAGRDFGIREAARRPGPRITVLVSASRGEIETTI